MSFNLTTAQFDEFKELYLAQPVSVNGEFCIGKDYPVEVRPAGDKGMGVFAKRHIKRGEICCYYDGVITRGGCQALFTTGKHGFSQVVFDSDGDEKALAGFRTQLRFGGCAQMCNDASTTYTDQDDLTYLKNINVKEKQIAPNSMVFVATKRIKKGEELLYSYGHDYWKIHNERQTEIANGEDHSESKLWEYLIECENIQQIPKLKNKLKKDYSTKGETMHDYMKRFLLSELVCKLQHGEIKIEYNGD